MKKITDKLTLKGLQAKLRETEISLKRIYDYEAMGHRGGDLLSLYLEDLKKYNNALSQYRQDVTFLKANKIVKYSK